MSTKVTGDLPDTAAKQAESALHNQSSEAAHKILSETFTSMSKESGLIQGKFLQHIKQDDPTALDKIKAILPDMVISHGADSPIHMKGETSEASKQENQSQASENLFGQYFHNNSHSKPLAGSEIEPSAAGVRGEHVDLTNLNQSYGTEMEHAAKRLFGLEKSPPGELNPLGPEDIGDMIPPEMRNQSVADGIKHDLNQLKRLLGLAGEEQQASASPTDAHPANTNTAAGGGEPVDLSNVKQGYDTEMGHAFKRFLGLEKSPAGELSPLGPEDIGDMIPPEMRNQSVADGIKHELDHLARFLGLSQPPLATN